MSAVTVQELRDELAKYPPGLRVITNGYEGGYEDVYHWDRFIKHGEEAEDSRMGVVPSDFDGLRDCLAAHRYEGIVWWYRGEPVGKIKRRDFGLAWPMPRETPNAQ